MVKTDWDFYMCHVNGKLASIYVDLGLKQVAPDPTKPTILCIWLYLKDPNPENGLSVEMHPKLIHLV